MVSRFPPWIVKRLSLAPSDKKGGGGEEVNKTRNLLSRLDLPVVLTSGNVSLNLQPLS
ncbi:hypothetical protein ES705_38885 [subsurface metagenome]